MERLTKDQLWLVRGQEDKKSTRRLVELFKGANQEGIDLTDCILAKFNLDQIEEVCAARESCVDIEDCIKAKFNATQMSAIREARALELNMDDCVVLGINGSAMFSILRGRKYGINVDSFVKEGVSCKEIDEFVDAQIKLAKEGAKSVERALGRDIRVYKLSDGTYRFNTWDEAFLTEDVFSISISNKIAGLGQMTGYLGRCLYLLRDIDDFFED